MQSTTTAARVCTPNSGRRLSPLHQVPILSKRRPLALECARSPSQRVRGEREGSETRTPWRHARYMLAGTQLLMIIMRRVSLQSVQKCASTYGYVCSGTRCSAHGSKQLLHRQLARAIVKVELPVVSVARRNSTRTKLVLPVKIAHGSRIWFRSESANRIRTRPKLRAKDCPRVTL